MIIVFVFMFYSRYQIQRPMGKGKNIAQLKLRKNIAQIKLRRRRRDVIPLLVPQ